MESRKVILLTEAYFRGFLRLDYPFGGQSRLRERFILQRLEDSFIADVDDVASMMSAAVVSQSKDMRSSVKWVTSASKDLLEKRLPYTRPKTKIDKGLDIESLKAELAAAKAQAIQSSPTE